MSASSASSYEPNKTFQGNRRFRPPSNPWWPYIGDCCALEKYLKSKNGVAWLAPKFLNGLLRGISQVVFANNPLAGLVILIALFWANVIVGVAALVGATVAILTAVLMRQDTSSISAGLTTYNAVIVGTVTASLWTPLYGEALGVKMWSFVILGSALSVFITSAVGNILSSMKLSLPALTLPFNIVIVVLFVCLMPVKPNAHSVSTGNDPVAFRLQQSYIPETHLNETRTGVRAVRRAEDMSDKPTTEFEPDESLPANSSGILDWGQILTGIILSSGQVFGVEDVIASILIYIGIMIYSPILFMMSIAGAIMGTVFGIVFSEAPFTAVYTGIWGYNALLSASAVGGFFIVLTCHSFWNALANVLFTVVVQQTLIIAFKSANLPVFTLPFVISTLLFLSVTTKGNHLPRVSTITFPEMHRYEYREELKVKQHNKAQEKHSGADEIAEEKELVLTDVKVLNEEIQDIEEKEGNVDE